MTITSYDFSDDSLTLIYTDTDNLHENYIDDYNFKIYLDSQGDYIHIGYNYSKDREYRFPQQLDKPLLPPLQGPLLGPDGMEFLPISYLIFQNDSHLYY